MQRSFAKKNLKRNGPGGIPRLRLGRHAAGDRLCGLLLLCGYVSEWDIPPADAACRTLAR